MDRIYTNDDADVNTFIQYAKKNNWVVKNRQSYCDDELLFPDNSVREVDLVVQLENNDFNRYPYMDTLRFYSEEDGLLSNVDNYGNMWTLNDTGGYYNEYNGDGDEDNIVIDWRGNEINENDSVYCDYDNEYCLTNESIRVRKGEHGRGHHFIPNSPYLKYSEFSDCYYHKDDVVYSKYLKDWIYSKYSVKMYLNKEKSKWELNHKLNIHHDMGKIDNDYYINDILYKDDNIRTNDKGDTINGDYHFKDDEFYSLPKITDDIEIDDIKNDNEFDLSDL